MAANHPRIHKQSVRQELPNTNYATWRQGYHTSLSHRAIITVANGDFQLVTQIVHRADQFNTNVRLETLKLIKIQYEKSVRASQRESQTYKTKFEFHVSILAPSGLVSIPGWVLNLVGPNPTAPDKHSIGNHGENQYRLAQISKRNNSIQEPNTDSLQTAHDHFPTRTSHFNVMSKNCWTVVIVAKLKKTLHNLQQRHHDGFFPESTVAFHYLECLKTIKIEQE